MNSLKTYLIACALMGSAVCIQGAEGIDPKVIAASLRSAEEERQMRDAITTSNRLAAQRKEEEELALVMAISVSEADEKERKDREHKVRVEQTERDAKRQAQEEHDHLLAVQAQENEYKPYDPDCREQDRKDRDRKRRQEEEAATADLLRREQLKEQDRLGQEAAQRMAAQDRKREQERKAEEDEKRREAEDRKREAEHPIRGFASVGYKVHPQSGASCGLHAVDNGNKAYQCLIANQSPADILLQPLSGAVADIPVAQRDMLNQLQIAEIARQKLGIPSACFTLLPNFLQSKDELLLPLPQVTDATYLIHTDRLATTIHTFRTRPRVTHIFIINADAKVMRNDKGERVSTDGHWLAIVADKKDGMITLHYMDTGDAVGRRDVIDALQALIQHGNYHGMQLCNELQRDIRNIGHDIDSGNYAIALEALNIRVNLAHKADVINDARFPKGIIIEQLKKLLYNFEAFKNGRECAQVKRLLEKLR